MTNKTIIVATSNKAQNVQISNLIEGMSGFTVVARTGDLMNTYNQVESKLPNAVLISESLASLPEFEVMRALFSALDVRWLVLTAPNKAHRSHSGTNQGSDLFSVPGNASASVIEGQLRSLTRSRSCRRDGGNWDQNPPRSTFTRHPRSPTELQAPKARTGAHLTKRPLEVPLARNEPLILIGASTGGVDALLKVLSSFPADCPPTLIVQHTGSGFGESLAGLLNRQCAASVSLIQSATPLQRGSVIIGAGTKSHLVLREGAGYWAQLKTGPHVSGHLPSVDMLFKSCIRFAPQVSAAILTGMGKDGAEGLLELNQAGATTLAQNEASSVVYGMPRAAVENGAAQSSLSIEKIGPALLKGPNRDSTQPRKAFL